MMLFLGPEPPHDSAAVHSRDAQPNDQNYVHQSRRPQINAAHAK
jgi:hypothetical protein